MIELLPDNVVDQIAAGEVVERPASVVKELSENALDAGARQLTIEIEGGGKDLIRILDDGCGMSPAEAELALRRHATSKLRRLDDLFGLSTFGFRGEALPSIASVSRMSLTTRARTGASSAFRLEIEGGTIVSRNEVGAPVGTHLEVRDLLFNVPARRKFLKSDATEAAHITDVVHKLALANPAVHVRLRHRQRTTINAHAHRDGYERARALLGNRGELVRAAAQVAGISIEAYLAGPEAAQTTARGVQLFVARRPVRDRGLLHAVVQGYGELLAKGRYPVAVVFIEVPDPDLDVNVHPQKLEVRFADGQAVFAALRHTVREAIATAPWAAAPGETVAEPTPGPRAQAHASAMARELDRARTRSLFGWRRPTLAEARFPMAPPRVEEPVSKSAEGSGPLLPEPLPRAAVEAGAGQRGGLDEVVRDDDLRRGDGAGGQYDPEGGWRSGAVDDGRDATGPGVPDGAWQGGAVDGGRDAVSPRGDRVLAVERRDAVGGLQVATEPVELGFFAQLRYRGQLDESYLLCEAEGELVLIDQQAARERVAFHRLRHADGPAGQRLLFPEPVELPPRLRAAADEHAAELGAAGFELGHDDDTVALVAAPAVLGDADPAAVLVDLLEALCDAGAATVGDRLDLVCAALARHAAARAATTLDAREVAALLSELDAIEIRATAPVLLRIPVADIARRFGRGGSLP